MPMDNEEHDKLEKEAAEYLKSLGYLVAKQAYHDCLGQEITDVIRLRFSLTALNWRSNADQLAIHPQYSSEFNWEIKTTPGPNWDFEALPLIYHIARARLGVRCLYICRNYETGSEFGFGMNNVPKPFRIHFPSRPEYDSIREDLRNLLKEFFPDIEINEESTKGSEDPFILVHKNIGEELSHWKELVQREWERLNQ